MIKVSRMRLAICTGSQKSKQDYQSWDSHKQGEKVRSCKCVHVMTNLSYTVWYMWFREKLQVIYLIMLVIVSRVPKDPRPVLSGFGKPHDNWQLQIILRITTCNWRDNKSKPLSSHKVPCKAKWSVFFPSQIFTLQQKRPKHVGRDTVMQHFLCITALTASCVGVEGIYTYIHMALYTHFQK